MKNKIKNLLLLFGIVFGSLISATQVNAQGATLTMNKSGYFWTRTSSDESAHSWYTQDYYFGDRVAYCIEPGVLEGTNNYIIGDMSNTNYSNEQKLKMLLIAYYGYDYPNHQTLNYKLATQALLWEVTGIYNISYSTQRWGAGSNIDVSAEKNTIMNLVNNHYVKPSFNGQTITMKVGDKITLTDTNNVLSNYDVIMSNNAEYQVNGNTITIRATNVGNITMQLKKKMYTTRQYLVYYGNGIQTMLSSGAVDPVYASVNINSLGGAVEFNKYDKDNNSAKPQGEATLNGATYGVYDKNTDALISKVTTNSNGYGKLEHLPYFGEFYLQEIEPSTGYQLDNTKYYFTSSLDNIDNSIIVKEKVINRDIELTKVYATDESKIMTPEQNVEFGFYNNKGELYKTGKTDKNGKLNINLVYGTYTVKQLTTSKDTTKVDDFQVKVYGMGDKIYYTISNAEITAKLKVVKIDSDTEQIIERSNIKFKIFNLDTGEYVSQTITYPTAKTIDVFETDSNGILITPYPLKAGTYYLEEVDQKIDGYLWNKNSVEFKIGEDSKLINDEEFGILFEVKFENKAVKGSLELIKTGEKVELTDNGYIYTKVNLKGVKIGLYAKENIYDALGNLKYKKDTLVKELITDENGYVKVDDLYLGKYYLQEIETVNNHVLDKTKYEFELKYKDQYTEVINYKTTLKNHLPKGTLEFTKFDYSNSKTLPNTLIEIYNENDELVYSGRTDENGKIIIDKLPVGKYYILEKEAPEGYKINEEKMYFEITEDGQVVKCNMLDETYEVPNTGLSNINYELIGSIVLIVSGLGLFFMVQKKENKKFNPIKIIGLLLFACGMFMIIYNYSTKVKLDENNDTKIEEFFDDDNASQVEESKEDKQENTTTSKVTNYNYIAVLEIPSINLKRGLVDPSSKYNNVNYNIKIIDKSSMPDVVNGNLVLASHNGASYISFFKNLYKLNNNDKVYVYYNGYKYEYSISKIYDTSKDGHIEVYRDNQKTTITLITCKKNTKDTQTVYIGYLTNKVAY